MKGEKAFNLHTPVSAAGLHANQNLGHSEHLGGLLGGFEELRLEPAGELRREHAPCFEQKYILLSLRSIKKFSGFSSSFYNPSFIRFLSLSLSISLYLTFYHKLIFYFLFIAYPSFYIHIFSPFV